MPIVENNAEIFLQPGDWHFGEGKTRIRTVLGTCVSAVFWHPVLHIGGMCHYMLPGCSPRPGSQLDGRYAEDAFALMLCEIRLRGTQPSDYRVKLVGGGDMFPGSCKASARHIGMKNADAARALVRRLGLQCAGEDLGGIGHRQVVFDVREGSVLVRQVQPATLSRQIERAMPCSA